MYNIDIAKYVEATNQMLHDRIIEQLKEAGIELSEDDLVKVLKEARIVSESYINAVNAKQQDKRNKTYTENLRKELYQGGAAGKSS